MTVGEPAPEQTWLEKNATLVEMKRIYGATIRYFTTARFDNILCASKR